MPRRIAHWPITSLQQRLVKTGGRLVKHARYHWLLLAKSHLTKRFGSMVRRISKLPLACRITETARQEEKLINNEAREGEVFKESLRAAAVPGGKGQ